MSQRKPIIASNPKPLESYMEMFSLIFEYVEEFEKTIEELVKKDKFDSLEFSSKEEQDINFKHYILVSYFNDFFGFKDRDLTYSLSLKKNIINYIYHYFFDDFVLLLLVKNNQIEALIKTFRASLSRNLLLIHYQLPLNANSINLASTLNESINDLHVSQWVANNEKLQKLSVKIFNKYYNLSDIHNNIKSLNLSRYILTDLKSSFTHLKSVIDKNENFRLKYNQLDFKGKSISEIEDTLNALEKEIDESKDSSLVYEGREETEYNRLWEYEKKLTSLFLKVDDTYSWYLINADSSELEAFIGSKGSGDGQHCGTPSQGESCLLSLRSLNEKGQFILHATCASHRVESDNGDFIYQLTEMRSRRNQPIKPELWPYMYALYTDERIVSEGSASYAKDRSFSFNWFNDLPDFFKYTEKEKILYKKMYNEIINNKPFINDFNKAMSEYCLLIMTKNYAINIIEQTDFFSFLSREIIQEILRFYDIKDGSIYLEKYIQFSNVKNLLKGENSDFILQRIIVQKFDEESVSFKVVKKLKSKLKKKKLGKNQLLKVINKYVQIERGIIVLTIEDEHTFRHYMDLEGSGLEWYLKVLEDPFYKADDYIDSNFPEMIYPENHQRESDVNLKEVLEYLKTFEERTHIQVYSPIEEDYNKTEMILSMDEHFYENIISTRRQLKGDFGDFADNIFEAIMTAYRDTCRSSTEAGIQKAILEGIDGIEIEGYNSGNAICEFSNSDTAGIIDVIFRLDEHNIENIMENDFELEELDSKLNKRHEIDIFHYGYEFDFDQFTELLHDQLYENFA